MTRKIEKLLRIVGDMRMLEDDRIEESAHKVIDLFGELSESDLDLVAAAAKEPDNDPFGKKGS